MRTFIGSRCKNLYWSWGRLLWIYFKLPLKKIKKIGNSALEGATKLLLSYKLRKNLLNYVTKIDHLELETKEEFFDYFVEGCQFKEISV